jgi:hypothetical protein
MGQDESTSDNAPRADRPTRRPRAPHQRTDGQGGTDALVGREEKRPRAPTLKEQWQAKKEANALIREANAAERQRKKEALHAALVAQQKQAENAVEGERSGDGKATGDDAEELRLRHAAVEAEAALTEAQVSAQLAVFQAFMQNCPDAEDEVDAVDGNPASMFDRDVASKAAQKTLKDKGRGSDGSRANAGDDDESVGDVSVHSSDYEDEELLQGLAELDEELEAEFQHKIEALQAAVAQHKQASLACLRERGDKAGALQELQKAKALEAEIKQLLDSHVEPLRVQIDKQARKIAELEELVAARKQESLSALRGGDKPTALEKLRESKGFQSQLDEAKAKMAALEEERVKQLHSTGEN